MSDEEKTQANQQARNTKLTPADFDKQIAEAAAALTSTPIGIGIPLVTTSYETTERKPQTVAVEHPNVTPNTNQGSDT